MIMRETDTNKALLEGRIISGFTFSHELFGEKFYMTMIEVMRLSGTKDVIPVMISERLINVNANCFGAFVRILGQFRSYNKHEHDRNRLVLSIFAKEVFVFDDKWVGSDTNEIYLEGYICKPPVYREAPLEREISDLLIAVNRPYGKSDYIPCICWGRNARFASGLEVGTRLRMQGRIQSREYVKRLSDTEGETRTAYEVSIQRMEVVNENSNT